MVGCEKVAGVLTKGSNVGGGEDAYPVTMTKKLLFVSTVLLAVAFVASAADVTGKWTYETPGRGGGAGTPASITLKADGAKLTGTVSGGMGRGGGGGAPAETEISNGKVDGNNISFEVKRTTPNGDFVTKYEGTLSGDDLKLKITRPGRNGGDPQTNEVTAKRAAS